jgi:hypothetical protein
MLMGSKQVSVRFSEEELKEIQGEADRLKVNLSAFIRSSVLMRITGDLIEKKVASEELTRRSIALGRFNQDTF